jgi:hypothetical protein
MAGAHLLLPQIPACTDNFTGASGGAWATASNWTTIGNAHAVPTSADVACWPAGTVVTASSGIDVAGSIQGGELDLNGGDLSLENTAQGSTLVTLNMSAGYLSGPGPLAVSGSIAFTGGEMSDHAPVSITQSGGGPFTISGSSSAYIAAGSVSTASNVSITSSDFATAGGVSFNTTGEIDFGSGVVMQPASGAATFTAGGVGANSGPLYGFAGNHLVLTGGTTTVANGTSLQAFGTTLEGGALRVDGALKSNVTLTSGTLSGTGSVYNLTNNGGAVAPGDGAVGTLAAGSYSQGPGATLAIAVDGAGTGQYSTLQAASLTLDGTLELEPSSAYTSNAKLGDDLAILPYLGFQNGTFASVISTPTLLNGLSFTTYNNGGLSFDAKVVGLPQAPANQQPPALSGSPQQGDLLQTTNGSWSNNPTSFTYQWEDCTTAAESSCTPIAGATQNAYTLTASDAGLYVTAIVSAHNAAATGSATATPPKGPIVGPQTTPPPPPAGQTPKLVVGPSVNGTPLPGNTLTCNPGTWTGNPSFTYSWQVNSNTVPGATRRTYVVTILDEGQTITCSVTAGGTTHAATSGGKVVAIQGTLTCPKPSGTLNARNIGRLALGATKATARLALTHYKVIGYGFDNFCLYGGWGIRAGYKHGSIALLLTANPFYSVDGVSPGLTLASAQQRLRVGRMIAIGANDWYVASGTRSNYVFKVRHGMIQEVGIAIKRDTANRGAQEAFLSGFRAG